MGLNHCLENTTTAERKAGTQRSLWLWETASCISNACIPTLHVAADSVLPSPENAQHCFREGATISFSENMGAARKHGSC